MEGLFVYDRPSPQHIHYLPIDCTSISATDLQARLDQLHDFQGTRIVYLDEVHRLARRQMDELLLKPVEETNFLWLASSATVEGLEPMFVKRFIIRRTELPTIEQLALWLANRCKAWRIRWDRAESLVLLAERAGGNPGMALQVLAIAQDTPERTLTQELVVDHMFVVDE